MCIARTEQSDPEAVGGLLLLMSVLSQTLLTLVRSHFVFFSFFSAWHNVLIFFSPSFTEGCVKNYFKSFRYESRLLAPQDPYPFVLLFQTALCAFFLSPLFIIGNSQQQLPLNMPWVDRYKLCQPFNRPIILSRLYREHAHVEQGQFVLWIILQHLSQHRDALHGVAG